MSTSLSAVKQDLRRQMFQKLRALSEDLKTKAGDAAKDLLSAHFVFKKTQVVMMYTALPSEVSLSLSIQMAWDAGKIVALPRVSGKDLQPHRVTNLEGDLMVGVYNVLEPRPHCDLIELGDLDLVFVPGLAFDRLGWRLGRGKGFYDRFLNLLPETCHTIGICFKVQLLRSVPCGPNDVCVKEVIAV